MSWNLLGVAWDGDDVTESDDFEPDFDTLPDPDEDEEEEEVLLSSFDEEDDPDLDLINEDWDG